MIKFTKWLNPHNFNLKPVWSTYVFTIELLHNITITRSGAPISGETYNLTCTVEANVQPTVQWLYSSNGTAVVTNESGITVGTQKNTGSTTTLTLSFNPLSTSHGGQYTCQSRIDTPLSTVFATRNATVQGELCIYTCDAQYMQYLNKNCINSPEMLV